MDAVDRSQLELLRVETKSSLDRLSDKVDNLSRAYTAYAADHEKRMRSVEKWKLAIPASALMVVAAFLGGRVL